jgi:hypothetical protein
MCRTTGAFPATVAGALACSVPNGYGWAAGGRVVVVVVALLLVGVGVLLVVPGVMSAIERSVPASQPASRQTVTMAATAARPTRT